MPISYKETISPESKMRSPDRVFKLEQIDGTKSKSASGLVDPRLFKDGPDSNRLHAVMDLQTSLWSLKYDKGAIPQALASQFTGFNQLKQYVENYFRNRNIKITEVYD